MLDMSMTFTFNLSCNKQCIYCIQNAPYINSRDIDISVKKQIFKYYPTFYRCMKELNCPTLLCGGEPGLIPDDLLDLIVQYPPDDILTNGTILKHRIILDNITKYKNIIYHISPDITKNRYISEYTEYDNIVYQVIIHKLNIDILEQFLNNNQHIIFKLDLNVNTKLTNIKQMQHILVKDDIRRIVDIIEPITNITNTSKQSIKNSLLDRSLIDRKRRCFNNRHGNIYFNANTISWCTQSCPIKQESIIDIHFGLIFKSLINDNEDDFIKYCLPCSILNTK